MKLTKKPGKQALDKLRKENLQLREAAKRNIAELSKKNRELEIETALEKVRAVAMGMKEPVDMLRICKIISQQMEKLGVADIRNVQTAIIDEEKGNYLNYEYFTQYNRTSVLEIVTKLHPAVRQFVRQILKSKDSFFTKTFKGEALKTWRGYRKKTGQDPDPVLDKAKSLHYYFYSIGPGALGISTYAPLRKEDLELFKRFRNVFGLAYSRFIDIQKAEAQAREATIQLALERVRARTMAMRKSDELRKVVSLLLEQMKTLGFEAFISMIVLYNKRDKSFEVLMSSDVQTVLPQIYHVPDFNHPFRKKFNVALEENSTYKVFDFKGKTKRSYDRLFFTVTDFKNIPESSKQMMTKVKACKLCCAYMQYGCIEAIGLQELTEENANVLQRFARIFEQTYTRFLDLQKAEAQAKEAEIELGLERVRAKAMSMQHSNELADLVAVVFRELTHLGFSLTSCIIWIHDHAKAINTIWIASAEMNTPPQSYTINPFHGDFFKSIVPAWKARDPRWTFALTGGRKKEFEKAFFKELPGLPIAFKRALKNPEQVVFSASFNNFGALEIVETESLTSEKFDILHRFGRVFDLSYTRFNDLQKAEAQAREAKIEAALERVRSRTMAMHRSEELAEVASVIFLQLKELDIRHFASGFVIFDNERPLGDMWMSFLGDVHPKPFHLNFENNPVLAPVYKSWKEGKPFYINLIEGEQYVRHVQFLQMLFGSRITAITGKFRQAAINEGKEIPEHTVMHHTYFRYGSLLLNHVEPIKEQEILNRFANVFEQTYTRFLDLQKAEAQAREAQIEAALEKVRSRSLAMHKSDELQEVVHTVFEKLKELNVDLYTAIIFIFEEDSKNFVWWLANKVHQQYARIVVPYSDNAYLKNIIEARATGKEFFSATYSFEEKNDLFHHLFEHTDFKHVPVHQKQFLLETELATMSVALAKNTGINITSYSRKSFSESENEILKRFAKVFEQAYTRFLDLQKAEEQTREAQIEAALERVRAKAMAMHKSEDLHPAVAVVFDELEKLNPGILRCGIAILDRQKPRGDIWMTIRSDLGSTIQLSGDEPLDYHPLLLGAYKSWLKQEDFSYVLQDEELVGYYEAIKKEIKFQQAITETFHSISETSQLSENERRQYYFNAVFNDGSLFVFQKTNITDEAKLVIKRFANVFNLTYKRFLDLQKAEAQSREAQIELGLERVRARAMAMQSSNELSELVDTVFKELTKLDFALTWCIINIIDESSLSNTVWAANPDINKAPESYHMLFENYPFHHAMMKGWKERKTKDIYVLEGQEKKTYDEYLFNETEFRRVPAAAQAASRAMEKYVVSFSFSNFGGLQTVGEAPLSDANLDILSRFGKVFDLTYTRFNDLKQAEAQAREAQIEASLERVRSKAMAMHKSEDINPAVAVVFEEMEKLNLGTLRCGIGILSKEKITGEVWTTHQSETGNKIQVSGNEPLDIHPLLQGAYNAWLEQKDFDYLLENEDQVNYYKALTKTNFQLPESELVLTASEEKKQYYYVTPFEAGTLFAFRETAFPGEAKTVMKRFANVFNLTYKRFLDIQKAEAQAREAKIEAALERTRAQSMIMQHSKELDDTLRVFHEQIVLLGIDSAFSFLWLPDEDKNRHIFWAAWGEDKNSSTVFKSKAINYPLDRNEPATAQCLVDWRGKEPVVSYHVPPAGVENYFAAWQELIAGAEQLEPKYFRGGLYYVEAFMKYGCFGVMLENDLTDEEKKVLLRFATEFERTYTRFLDLQKAEAQAREAQIEASLERVRAHAMAMHNSEDLSSTVNIFFRELKTLGIIPMRCGVGEMNETTQTSDLVFTTADKQGELYELPGKLKHEGHPVVENIYNYWKRQEEYYPVLQGTDINAYYRVIKSQMTLPDFPEYTIHYGKYFYFKEGFFFAWAEKEFTDEAMNIFRRFTSVLSLTYKRYKDLKQAESNAREAQIETALERVRSRTLAMQKSGELAETAAVLFKQLILLGIEPNRLYITVIKDERGEAEFWITDEDGSRVSSAYTTNLNDNITLRKMYEGWKQQSRSLIIDMQGKELEDYFSHLAGLDVPFRAGLMQKRRIQQLAYFSKGFIGMASPVEQPEETLLLLERFALVFNLTFTRFNDLQLAEAHALQAEKDLVAIKEAKQKAEETLNELQATQKQLIQSEKMASLGELTAGIAHEIQNPLNFVNNFSEVSNELLEEMKHELETGNRQQATEIANDVKQNLEKIIHHGKRADAIVKGMLQHSRTSSGQKEMTDINVLADEYLRLAYHGLRAKDKTFNAKFETILDPSIEKINVVPQDIGRVILNLINNAFYAVSEKRAAISDQRAASSEKREAISDQRSAISEKRETSSDQRSAISEKREEISDQRSASSEKREAISDQRSASSENYEPTVTVSTKKMNGKVEIKVKDNGNGIPQKVLDKIFQPFFTTKPTGEGTGLGLSLSYDIITKGHGGELKVETKEGEGSEFTIQLPIN
jgi:signal transduction histidine kinase